MSVNNYKIPNIIHFIHISGYRKFSFCNMLAVLSAYKKQNPEKLYLYYTEEENDNRWWNITKNYVTLVKIEPIREFKGIRLNYPQYQADIIRLQKLVEMGGIYLDTDILTLKSYDPLRTYDCVLGGEGYLDHVEGLNTNDLSKIGSISNAVIMAEPNNRFIKEWLDIMPSKFNHSVWAYHAVVLPKEMISEDKTLFHLEKVESFIPFDFRNPYIFDEVGEEISIKLSEKLRDSYCFHLWETIWRENFLNRIDEDYLEKSSSLFADLFKKYLKYIDE